MTAVVGGDTVKDTRYGIEIAGACNHITIENNDLYNMEWTRDTVKARNPEPNDVLSAITVLGNSNTPISNLYISNNTIHNIVPGYAEGMTMNGNVDTFTIIGNEIYDVANIGICGISLYIAGSYIGGHTIISNNFWSNLGPGIYLGSNNPTSTCSDVVVKYNTISDDWTINPTLYARANGRYGTLDSAGQGPEMIMQRIQNLTVDENDVYSTSDNVLEFAFSQSGLTFTYLGGTAYSRHGCGTYGASTGERAANGLGSRFVSDSMYAYPNPVMHGLFVRIRSGAGGPASLQLMDVSGWVLLRQEVQLQPGVNDIGWTDVKEHGLAPGLYIVELTLTTGRSTAKIIVQ